MLFEELILKKKEIKVLVYAVRTRQQGLCNDESMVKMEWDVFPVAFTSPPHLDTG